MEQTQKTKTEEIHIQDWLNEEKKELEQMPAIQNRKPALKLEENKLCEFDLVQGAKWEKWVDPDTGTIKKIIPVKQANEERVLFMNVQNPTYRTIVEQASKGKMHFKIVRVGNQKNTRLNIIE